MKIMSWNTLFGGFDGSDARRFELQRETVNDTAPDILLIQEARHFEVDGSRRLYEIEKAFGMRGFLALAPHTGQNTAIFIRPPIQLLSFVTDNVRFHHAAAIAQLKVPNLPGPLTCASLHLCPVGVEMSNGTQSGPPIGVQKGPLDYGWMGLSR